MRDKRAYLILALLVTVFTLSRLLVLWLSPPELFNSEDLAMGAAGREIMRGATLPLFEYEYLPHSGGTLVVGLVAVPFFLLFGPSYFALKLVPLLFSSLTFCALFLFAARFFGLRIAVIAGSLSIVSSTTWTAFTLFLGFHGESLLFSALALYLAYALVFEGRREWWRWALLGLVSGFGIFFSYTFLVVFACLLVVLCAHGRRLFTPAGSGMFCAGFLLGFSPWLRQAGVTGIQAVAWPVNEICNDKGWKEALLFLANYPRGFWFPYLLNMNYLGDFFSRLYGAAYNLAYLFAGAAVAWSQRFSLRSFVASKYFFFFLYPAVLLGVLRLFGADCIASPVFESRYLMGLYPVIFLITAVWLDGVCDKVKGAVPAAALAVTVPLVISVVSFWKTPSLRAPGNFASRPGYSYFYLCETFNFRHSDDLLKILDNISRLRDPERGETLTMRLTYDLQDGHTLHAPDRYMPVINRFPPRYRPFLYRLYIEGHFYNSGLAAETMARETAGMAARIPPEYVRYFYEGIGCCFSRTFERVEELAEARRHIPGNFLDDYERGLAAVRYGDDIPAYIARCETIMTIIERRKPFLEGMGEAVAKFGATTFVAGLPEDDPGLARLHRFLEGLAGEERQVALREAGLFLSNFYDANTGADVTRFITTFRAEDRQTIAAGLAQGRAAGDNYYGAVP